MRLKLNFGISDGVEYVPWFKDIKDFEKHLRYKGSVYEFVMYDSQYHGHYDYSLTFSKTNNYPGSFYSIPTFESLFGPETDSKCSCGARFDRGNPNHHYSFCKFSKEKL